VKEKIISRIEQLSENMQFLLNERDRKLQELNSISSELDTTSAILFELKSLLEEYQEETVAD
jgi:hypothetical protein